MYRYDEFDHQLVAERVAQFRGQVERRVSGELSEDAFKPLRLMNGVYLQLHAYMLRVAIPYGTLSSRQLRKLAHIAREYDRGYGHFTTRQNIQYNWPLWRAFRICWPSLPKLRCTPSRLPAIASAMSPRTNMPVPLPTRLKTRALFPRLSGNGRPSIRNFLICRASSKSPSPAMRMTARPSSCTISALSLCAMRPVRSAMRFMWRRSGAHALHCQKTRRICAEGQAARLSGSGDARLQHAGAA